MSTRRLVILLTFLAVFAMAARVSIDNDTWWHMRIGQWMVEHHAFMLKDVFSFTRHGVPWYYPGWLIEVPLYWIYQLSGPAGLNLLTAAIVSLALFFVWLTLNGGVFLKAFTLVLAAAVSAVYWAARPYLLTFLLAAVFLWVLEGWRWRPARTTERRLWLLPVLMVVWVNSHGGFFVGFILIGIYLAGELVSWLNERWMISSQRRDNARIKAAQHRLGRLFLILVLTFLALNLNPAGPSMLLYPLKTVGIQSLQEYIQEWQSPDFHTPQVQPFLVLLLATFAAVGASRRRLALTDFLLVSGFAYLGFLAARNIALFAIAAPPVLTRHAAPVLEAMNKKLGIRISSEKTTPPRLKIINVALLILLLIALIGKVSLVLPAEVNDSYIKKISPTGAVQFLKENHPGGNLFNSYNQGGYLIWALPEYPVFIDPRTDLYNDELIQLWLKVMRAEPGWEQVLTQYGIGIVMVEPNAPIVTALKDDQGWRESYRDSNAVIFLRN